MKIAWWAWYYGPYLFGVAVLSVGMVMFVGWTDARQSERYRHYIAKYHCEETAVETPAGYTYFRYVCKNGYRFTLGSKP